MVTNAIDTGINRVYTIADRPDGMHPKLWQMLIDQGKVESSRGENLPEITQDYWESDEEFEEFLQYIRDIRAEGRSK